MSGNILVRVALSLSIAKSFARPECEYSNITFMGASAVHLCSYTS